jgi:hypothetical protein
LEFISQACRSISPILGKIELSNSFSQAIELHKSIQSSLKKSSIPFCTTSGIMPVLLVMEPVLPKVKGCAVNETIVNKAGILGPKGLAQAQALAEKNDISALGGKGENQASGNQKSLIEGISAIDDQKIREITNGKSAQLISALEAIEIMVDFSHMIEILAERCKLKKPKRFGDIFCKI